jgi:hypothetical protein
MPAQKTIRWRLKGSKWPTGKQSAPVGGRGKTPRRERKFSRPRTTTRPASFAEVYPALKPARLILLQLLWL